MKLILSTLLIACMGMIINLAAGMEQAVAAGTQPVSVPCGIFALDNKRGTVNRQGASLRDANIRDYPFVRGYAWRTSWADLESSEDSYEFSSIDHIIGKVEPLGQKLALLIRSFEPEYVGSHAEVASWQDEHKRRGRMTRAVPWSPYLADRFERFMRALSTHKVYSKALGKSVMLKDHPALEVINMGVPGYGPLRKTRTHNLKNLPGYTRGKFTDALLGSIRVVRENFPRQHYLIGFWKITDENPSPPLYESLRIAILEEFNGIDAPAVGFFQDNLAAGRNPATGTVTGYPATRFAMPLYKSRNDTYIGFQALQGWKRPFRNKQKVANATPADGIRFAYETYNARYFELYVTDLDDPEYAKALDEWNSRLCAP